LPSAIKEATIQYTPKAPFRGGGGAKRGNLKTYEKTYV